MTVHDLPAVNATLNALSGVLLLIGYVLIRARRIEQHRRVHDRGVRHLVALPGLLRRLPRAGRVGAGSRARVSCGRSTSRS